MSKIMQLPSRVAPASNPVIPDPAVTHSGEGESPGEQLAAAVAHSGGLAGELTVPIAAHLPAAFPLFASRPRYPVRHLLKTATLDPTRPATFVYEPRRHDGGARSGVSYAATPEAAFDAQLAEAHFTDLTVALALPDGLLSEPMLLASFVDYRVLVRVSVVENETLLHGSRDGAVCGLLAQPGIRRRATHAALERAVIESAALVEETGGSCDGIVAHPFDYWEMVRIGLLDRLQTAGVTVSRTRMIPAGSLLLGDFRAAATLLITNDSDLTVRRNGSDGATIEARTRVGLAMHLPQHLMLLSLEESHG